MARAPGGIESESPAPRRGFKRRVSRSHDKGTGIFVEGECSYAGIRRCGRLSYRKSDTHLRKLWIQIIG